MKSSISSLSLVADDDAFGTDGPAVAAGHEESVEGVGGGTFLPDPGAALVGRAKDRALVADDPAVLIVGEIDSHQGLGKVGDDAGPRSAAVLGPQDRAALTDSITFVVVAKVDIEECVGRT